MDFLECATDHFARRCFGTGRGPRNRSTVARERQSQRARLVWDCTHNLIRRCCFDASRSPDTARASNVGRKSCSSSGVDAGPGRAALTRWRRDGLRGVLRLTRSFDEAGSPPEQLNVFPPSVSLLPIIHTALHRWSLRLCFLQRSDDSCSNLDKPFEIVSRPICRCAAM